MAARSGERPGVGRAGRRLYPVPGPGRTGVAPVSACRRPALAPHAARPSIALRAGEVPVRPTGTVAARGVASGAGRQETGRTGRSGGPPGPSVGRESAGVRPGPRVGRKREPARRGRPALASGRWAHGEDAPRSGRRGGGGGREAGPGPGRAAGAARPGSAWARGEWTVEQE